MKTGLALLGCGTVGTAVAEMLLAEKKLLQERSGQSLELKHILVRNRRRKRAVKVPARLWTTNPADIWADPSVDVVVELIGGLEPARTLALAALRAGKHLVAANKHLLVHSNGSVTARTIWPQTIKPPQRWFCAIGDGGKQAFTGKRPRITDKKCGSTNDLSIWTVGDSIEPASGGLRRRR